MKPKKAKEIALSMGEIALTDRLRSDIDEYVKSVVSKENIRSKTQGIASVQVPTKNILDIRGTPLLVAEQKRICEQIDPEFANFLRENVVRMFRYLKDAGQLSADRIAWIVGVNNGKVQGSIPKPRLASFCAYMKSLLDARRKAGKPAKAGRVSRNSGTTRKEMAKAIGIGEARLSRISCGYEEPNFQDVVKLAIYFQVPTIDMLKTIRQGYELEFRRNGVPMGLRDDEEKYLEMLNTWYGKVLEEGWDPHKEEEEEDEEESIWDESWDDEPRTLWIFIPIKEEHILDRAPHKCKVKPGYKPNTPYCGHCSEPANKTREGAVLAQLNSKMDTGKLEVDGLSSAIDAIGHPFNRFRIAHTLSGKLSVGILVGSDSEEEYILAKDAVDAAHKVEELREDLDLHKDLELPAARMEWV